MKTRRSGESRAIVPVRHDSDVGADGDYLELAFVTGRFVLCRPIALRLFLLSLPAGPISLRVAKRPMGSAPPGKTFAAGFFPRRIKNPAPRGRCASKKPSAQVLRMRSAPQAGSKAFRFP